MKVNMPDSMITVNPMDVLTASTLTDSSSRLEGQLNGKLELNYFSLVPLA